MADAEFAIYYDFRCPFVYNAATVLAKAKESAGIQLEIDWRPFSLSQVNSDKGPGFKYWGAARGAGRLRPHPISPPGRTGRQAAGEGRLSAPFS